MATMPKIAVRWEYMVLYDVQSQIDAPAERFEGWLSKMGAEGWELVQYFPDGAGAAIFKRAAFGADDKPEYSPCPYRHEESPARGGVTCSCGCSWCARYCDRIVRGEQP